MPEPLSPVRVVAFDETVASTAPVHVKTVSAPDPLADGIHADADESRPIELELGEEGHAPEPAQSENASTQTEAPRFPTLRKKSSKTALLPDGQRSLKSPRSNPSIPSIVVDESSRPSSRWSERKWGALRSRLSTESVRARSSPAPATQAETMPFEGITMNIPSADLGELALDSLQFSNRGSLLNEKKPTSSFSAPSTGSNVVPSPNSPRKRMSNTLRVRQSITSPRAVSADEDMLSRRVRLMYEKGDDNVTDAEVTQAIAEDNGVLWEETTPVEDGNIGQLAESNLSTTNVKSIASTGVNGLIKRESKELAGGIEDWQNVDAGDVDRYGFIVPRQKEGDCAEPHPLQRVSTSLLEVSETPRRRNTFRRSMLSTHKSSSRSLASKSPTRERKTSESSYRPSSSQSAYNPALKRSPSKFRYAANRLPHNRDRRVRDEAGDMLTLPFEVPETRDDTPAAHAMKRKEWEREDKWKKMAKLTKKSQDGSGMTFEFDTHSSKLIERTWKGIPDSWRGAAWYAFLESSAKKRKDSPTAQELIQSFHELQGVSSPDDVQIDIDVPRTISSHIMFRRRYRGGQRLLFRVLHAMSLYFPDTGYVQGMAALTATLLAYYDEENAFVMLARLWMLRGLEQLYREGFSGLMEALGDFKREWLGNGEVANKLNDLGIPPTAYGTRWYLTLFNYSIPFPAQLRVWDVFMLLGDPDEPTKTNANGGSVPKHQSGQSSSSFGKGLDVLHATSAALIDGMRDIILESDFENAMKVLTSWVPIKDIELFMRVARAEYKVHRHRKKGG